MNRIHLEMGNLPISPTIFRKVAQIVERAAWDGEVEMAEFSFPTTVISLKRKKSW